MNAIATPMITPNSGSMNHQLPGKASPSPSSMAQGEKVATRAPQINLGCEVAAKPMHKASKETAAEPTSCSVHKGDAFIDYFTQSRWTKTKAEHASAEYVQRWEAKALNHFRKSAWEDVIHACNKVLQVPGQAKTNFDILYEMGYAYMRLEDYETAIPYFKGAHRIDSNRVSLRLVLGELRRRMTMGPWQKKRRRTDAAPEEEERPSKKPFRQGIP